MPDEHRLSEEGLEMLTGFEGTVLHCYIDQAGVVTVGTGHALTAAEKAAGAYAEGITRAEAKELLRLDVAKAEGAVNRLVKVPLLQNQFDALASFVFNIGEGSADPPRGFHGSTLLARLNAGEYEAVPIEMERWCKRRDPKTGQLVADPGLLRRRHAEAGVWSNGYTDTANGQVKHAAQLAWANQFTRIELVEDHGPSGLDDAPPTPRNDV